MESSVIYNYNKIYINTNETSFTLNNIYRITGKTFGHKYYLNLFFSSVDIYLGLMKNSHTYDVWNFLNFIVRYKKL